MRTVKWIVRRIRWLLDNGPRRLKSARLRRNGKIVDAFVELAGQAAMFEAMRSIGNISERWAFYRTVARILSSPRASRRAFTLRRLQELS